MAGPTSAPTPDPRYNQTPAQPQPTAGSGDQPPAWFLQALGAAQQVQGGATSGKLNDRSQIYLGRKTAQHVMNTYANPKGKFGTVVKGNWEYDIATGEKVRYVGPLSKTTTSTQIN